MILVRDKGQMCNNIIQFGHVYAWAREHGLKAVSMRFAYKYQYFRICNTPWHNLATYVLGKLGVQLGLLPEVVYGSLSEDHEQDEQIMLTRWKPTVVSGWFVRHYDLFEKHIDEIRHLFSLHANLQKKVDKALAEIAVSGRRTIGVHIRRGDYRTFMNGRFYLDDDVYLSAIQQTMALHPNDKWTVIVCTNDRRLDYTHYEKSVDGACVCFPHGEVWMDLGLLSRCDYVIGAPSSFSLVATLLGNTRLHWLTRDDYTVSSEEDFQPFEIRFREFDGYFPT